MASGRLSCEEARGKLTSIRELYGEFEVALESGIRGRTLSRPVELMAEIQEAIHELERNLTAPIERRLTVNVQYEAQLTVLREAGLLEQWGRGGTEGITGIDGRRYPVPSLTEIRHRLRERNELLSHKAEQGFVKVLLVPLGLPLQTLIDQYGAALKRHQRAGRLFGSKHSPTDPDLQGLDAHQPVWSWSEYANADIEGKLVYFPTQFDQTDHGGKTKQQLFTDPTSPFPGWQVLLVEDLPNLPREGKGVTRGDRPQLEANQSPRQYLNAFQTNPSYQHEEGFTPEAWLTLALTQLEEKNQVLDDYQANGSIAYLPGAYFIGTSGTSGDVPGARWRRVGSQARLHGRAPGVASPGVGVRVSVRV